MILLQVHAVTLTFKVVTQILRVTRHLKIQLQITKLCAGHDFAARSCCDLDLQGSDPNVARNRSSQCGDHFSEIVLKSDFK